MADQFDPTQFGAVAVDEPPQPFDPTAHGAIPVQEPPKQEGGVLSGVASAIGSAINPINLVKGALGLGQPSDISNIIRYGKTLGEIVTGTKPDVAIGQNIPELQQEREAVFGQRGTKAQAEALTGIGLQLGLAAAPFVHGKTLLEAPSLAKVAEPLIGVKVPSTPMEAATEPLSQEAAPVVEPVTPAVEPQISTDEVAANREIAPVTEPPSATEQAPEPFPSISQGAEEQRRAELQQPQPTQVREAISLDELRLMRERNDLMMQNDIAQRVTGTTHPAVDERLGQIDEELTNIANTELQKATAEQKPPEPEGVTNAVEPSNAQVETGETPLRVEERTGSEVPATSSSDNALGETQGAAEPREISTRQGTEAGTQEAATGVTPEAQDLISKGGVPAFVSKNLKRIATENGVEVGNKTPNEIIDELKSKAQPQQTEAVPPAGTSGTGGVNAAAMEQRPIETPEVGQGVGKEETRAAGHEWLDKGGDINKVMSDFSRTGKVSEWDVGKGAAYLERLQSVTDKTADALRSNPNDPILQQQYGQALAREQTFSDAFKPMATTASNTLKGFQGKTTLSDEMADSFSGLNRKFREFQGKEMTEQEAVKADRLAKKNVKAKSDYSEANQNLYKKADETYAVVKGPSHVPTIQELSQALTGALEEVC